MLWDEGPTQPLGTTPLQPHAFVWAEVSFCRTTEPLRMLALLQVPTREGHTTPAGPPPQAMKPSREVGKTLLRRGCGYPCPQIQAGGKTPSH